MIKGPKDYLNISLQTKVFGSSPVLGSSTSMHDALMLLFMRSLGPLIKPPEQLERFGSFQGGLR